MPSAARSPAPPAPMITTSWRCSMISYDCVIAVLPEISGHPSVLRKVDGELLLCSRIGIVSLLRDSPRRGSGPRSGAVSVAGALAAVDVEDLAGHEGRI